MNPGYLLSTPKYPELARLMLGAQSSWKSCLSNKIIPYLIDAWLAHYTLASAGGEIVQVPVGKDSYLFDLGPDRLIAAWAISEGRFPGDRDDSRIDRFPVSARPIYHAGHAISHRLGGGTDINLVAQLGTVNTGAFKRLEYRAVKTPGSLYFTYWLYGQDPHEQRPARVQQGLLIPRQSPQISTFTN